jgi:hypothetical protein
MTDQYAEAKKRLLESFLSTGAKPVSEDEIKKNMLNNCSEHITQSEYNFEFPND